MYKLIAVDIDGTLLNDQKEITPENYNAIQNAKASGATVVLVSGRPQAGIQPIANKLGLTSSNDYMISFNGALIQRSSDLYIHDKNYLSYHDFLKLNEIAQIFDVGIQAVNNSAVYTTAPNQYTDIEIEINGIQAVYRDVEETDPDIEVVKVMFIGSPDKIEAAYQRIPYWLKKQYCVLRSAPYFLEFLDPYVNKGIAIKSLANYLNIDRSEILCIGDGGNDIDMFSVADVSVAMGNAVDELKQVSDYITYSNNDDGLAHAINHLVLNKRSNYSLIKTGVS